MKTEIVIEGDTSWAESLSIVFILGIIICAILIWLVTIIVCFFMGHASDGLLFLSIGVFASWLLKKLCLAGDN